MAAARMTMCESWPDEQRLGAGEISARHGQLSAETSEQNEWLRKPVRHTGDELCGRLRELPVSCFMAPIFPFAHTGEKLHASSARDHSPAGTGSEWSIQWEERSSTCIAAPAAAVLWRGDGNTLSLHLIHDTSDENHDMATYRLLINFRCTSLNGLAQFAHDVTFH